jgi:predicted DNA-binding transcriptional regulator AlpA
MNDVLPLRLVTPSVDDPGPTPKPTVEPLLLSARDLAGLLSVGQRTLRAMDAGGRIPAPVRLSPGCVRWKLSEIRDWLDAGAPDRATWARIRAARS